MVLRAEQVCTYDLDDVDQSWLNSLNGERALMALGPLTGILDKLSPVLSIQMNLFQADYLSHLLSV